MENLLRPVGPLVWRRHAPASTINVDINEANFFRDSPS
jgi:hypothetical protein